MNKNKQIGRRIAAIRKEKGLLQSDVAEKAGSSQEQVSRIERGVSAGSFELIIKIADALNCSTEDFLKD